jgi:hypothetical protein
MLHAGTSVRENTAERSSGSSAPFPRGVVAGGPEDDMGGRWWRISLELRYFLGTSAGACCCRQRRNENLWKQEAGRASENMKPSPSGAEGRERRLGMLAGAGLKLRLLVLYNCLVLPPKTTHSPPELRFGGADASDGGREERARDAGRARRLVGVMLWRVASAGTL